MTTDALLGWIMIGVAASLAVMIWPFRRGAAGIAVNVLAGVGGALIAGFLSHVVLPTAVHDSVRLLFAAAGALLALGAVHAVWLGRLRHLQAK